MLRVRVSTASAEIIETELITAGRRGLECAFEFNSAWDGLAKTVIVNGVVKRDIVLVSDSITVPGECLAREQFPLRIGVYGANGAGEIVIPTIWANFGKILPSARPSGVDPDEVTPDVVAQIQQNSSDAMRLAQDLIRRADSGEFDGRDGATGPSGPPGIDGRHGKNGNSIWTTTETPMPATGGMAFTQLTGRSAVPPIVGDIIIRSSRYVYDVVEVTPGGVVIGHQIGDIKGATGARGPKGDTGLTGPQGPGVTEDLRAALLQLAQKVTYIDEHGADYYQDLYDALYPPANLLSITAIFTQGSTVVYDDADLDDLRPMLYVVGHYDDNTDAEVTNYDLSGNLTAGSSVVTVSYQSKTTTFTVLVTARPTLSSISAVYTQSGTVYDTDTLDSLKTDLVVTAHYSDSSTQTVPSSDYTLSGDLTHEQTIVDLLDGTTWTDGIAFDDNGNQIDRPTLACSDYLPVTPGTLYTYSKPVSGGTDAYGMGFYLYDSNKGWIGRETSAGTQSGTEYVKTYTPASNVAYVRLMSYVTAKSGAEFTYDATPSPWTSTITVAYGGKTTTFDVTVTSDAASWRTLTSADIASHIGCSIAVDSNGTITASNVPSSSAFFGIVLAGGITEIKGTSIARSSSYSKNKPALIFNNASDGLFMINPGDPNPNSHVASRPMKMTSTGTYYTVADASNGAVFTPADWAEYYQQNAWCFDTEYSIKLDGGTMIVTNLSSGEVASITQANCIGFWGSQYSILPWLKNSKVR